MTEDILISLGLQAERILDDDDFNTLFKHIVDDAARAILATTIDQAGERERLNATVNGMRAYVDSLHQLALAKANIVNKRNFDDEL